MDVPKLTTEDLTIWAPAIQSSIGATLSNLGLEPEPTFRDPRLSHYLRSVQQMDSMVSPAEHLEGLSHIYRNPRGADPQMHITYVNSDHEETYIDPNTTWGQLTPHQRQRILFKKRIDILHSDLSPCTYSDLDRSFDDIVDEIEGSINRGLALSIRRKYEEPLLFQSLTVHAQSNVLRFRTEDYSLGRHEVGCEVKNGDVTIAATNSTDHFTGTFHINIPNSNVSYKYSRNEHHLPHETLSTRHQITYEKGRSMIEFDHKENDTHFSRPTTTTLTQTTLSNTYHLSQNVHSGMKFKVETNYPTLQECVQKWSISLATRIRLFQRILWDQEQKPYPATTHGDLYMEISSKGHLRTKIWHHLNDFSFWSAYLTLNPWKTSPSGYATTSLSDKIDGGISYVRQDKWNKSLIQTWSFLAKTNGLLQSVLGGSFPGLHSLAFKLSATLNIFQLLKPSLGVEFIYNTEHRPGFDTSEFMTPSGFSHYRLPVMDFQHYDASLNFQDTVTRWHEQQMDMFWTPEQKKQYRLQQQKLYRTSSVANNGSNIEPDFFLQYPEDQLQHCDDQQWNYIVHDDVFIENHPVLSKLPYRIAKVYNGKDTTSGRIQFPSPLVLKRYAHRKVYPYSADHKRGQISEPLYRNDEIEHLHYWGWFVRKKDTEFPTEISDVLTNPTFRFWMSIYRFEYLQKKLSELGVLETELQAINFALSQEDASGNFSTKGIGVLEDDHNTPNESFATGDSRNLDTTISMMNPSNKNKDYQAAIFTSKTRKDKIIRKTELDYELQNLRYQIASIQQAEMIAQLLNKQMDSEVESIKKSIWAQKFDVDVDDRKAMSKYDELDLMSSPYYPASQYYKQLIDSNRDYQDFTEHIVHSHGLHNEYNQFNEEKMSQWRDMGYNRDDDIDPLNPHRYDRNAQSLVFNQSFKKRTLDELERPDMFSKPQIFSRSQYFGLDEAQPHGVLRLQNSEATTAIERYLGMNARYVTHEQHLSERAKVIQQIEKALPTSPIYFSDHIETDISTTQRENMHQWQSSIFEPVRDLLIEGTIGVKSLLDTVSSFITSQSDTVSQTTDPNYTTQANQREPIAITVQQMDKITYTGLDTEPNAALELLLSESPYYPDPIQYAMEKSKPTNDQIRQLMKQDGIFNTLNTYFFSASKSLFSKYNLFDPNHPTPSQTHPVHHRTAFPEQGFTNAIDPTRHSPDEVDSLSQIHHKDHQLISSPTTTQWSSLSTDQKLTRMQQLDPALAHKSVEFTDDDSHSLSIDSIATEIPLSRDHIDLETSLYQRTLNSNIQLSKEEELARIKHLRASGKFALDDILAQRAYRLNTRLSTQQSIAELEFKQIRLKELQENVTEIENEKKLRDALETQLLSAEPETLPYTIEFEQQMVLIDTKLESLHDELRSLETKIRGYESRLLELQIRALDNPSNIKYQDSYRRALKDREEILTYYNLERKDIEKMENELESQRVQVIFTYTHRNTLLSNEDVAKYNQASQERFKKAMLQAELSERMYQDEVLGMIHEGKDKYIARHSIEFDQDVTVSPILDTKNELLLNQRKQLEGLTDREILYEYYDQIDDKMKLNLMFERPLHHGIDKIPFNTDLQHSPQINQYGQYDQDYSLEKLIFEQDIHRGHGYYPFHDSDSTQTRDEAKYHGLPLSINIKSADTHFGEMINRNTKELRNKGIPSQIRSPLNTYSNSRDNTELLPQSQISPTSPLFYPAFSASTSSTSPHIDLHRTHTTRPLETHHFDPQYPASLHPLQDRRHLLGVSSPDDDYHTPSVENPFENFTLPNDSFIPTMQSTSLTYLTPQSKLTDSSMTTQQTIQLYREFEQLADYYDLSEEELDSLKMNSEALFQHRQRSERDIEIEIERVEKYRTAQREIEHESKKKFLSDSSTRLSLLESPEFLQNTTSSPLKKQQELASKELSYYLNTSATYDEFELQLKAQGKHPDQLYTTRIHKPQVVQPASVWAENKKKLQIPSYISARGFDTDDENEAISTRPSGYKNNYINESIQSKRTDRINTDKQSKSQDEIDHYLSLEQAHMNYGSTEDQTVQLVTPFDGLFPSSAHPLAKQGGVNAIDRTAFTSATFLKAVEKQQHKDTSQRLTDSMLYERQRDVMGRLQDQHEQYMTHHYNKEYKKLRSLEAEVAWEKQFGQRYSNNNNSSSYQQRRDGVDQEMQRSAKERLTAQRRYLYGNSFALSQPGHEYDDNDDDDDTDADDDYLSSWSDIRKHPQVEVQLGADLGNVPHPYQYVPVEDRVEREEQQNLANYIDIQNKKAQDSVQQKEAREAEKKRERQKAKTDGRNFDKLANDYVENGPYIERSFNARLNPKDGHEELLKTRNKMLGKQSDRDEFGNKMIDDINVLPKEIYGEPSEYQTRNKAEHERKQALRQKIFEEQPTGVQMLPSFDDQPNHGRGKH